MNDKQWQMAATIIEAESRSRMNGKTTAEDALRVAFATAKNHWMFTDEETQFRGAVGAALITLKEGAEFERIARSVAQLSRIHAMINALHAGVPVDMEQMAADPPEEDLIPLQKMWFEEQDSKEGK
jgi:hypothetical protein